MLNYVKHYMMSASVSDSAALDAVAVNQNTFHLQQRTALRSI